MKRLSFDRRFILCVIARPTESVVAICPFRRATLSRNAPRTAQFLSLPDLFGLRSRWRLAALRMRRTPLRVLRVQSFRTDMEHFPVKRHKCHACNGQITTVCCANLAMTR